MVPAAIRSIYRHMPSGLRDRAVLLRARYYDRMSRKRRAELFGRNGYFVPPLELMHDGPKDYLLFKQNGEEFLDIATTLSGLRPEHRVLDVGSGIGRKTLPLIAYLSAAGSYEGLDIVRMGIRWCKERYTARYPTFRFTWMDVWNGMYNPSGKTQASEYHFPFGDREFDFVMLGSVFTHMLPDDMKHYMSEIARVLKPGGRSMISYFLLNAEAEQLMFEGRSSMALTHEVAPGCKVASVALPERAVAYDQDDIAELYAQFGLKATIYHGSWCGRDGFLTYQDMIIGEKL